MQVEVTREDQNVFLTVNGISATSETAARVYQGLAFTWEVEQLARHRHQARAEAFEEIERLEGRLAEAYQLAGSLAFDHDISGPDIERLLDLLAGVNLSKD